MSALLGSSELDEWDSDSADEMSSGSDRFPDGDSDLADEMSSGSDAVEYTSRNPLGWVWVMGSNASVSVISALLGAPSPSAVLLA